MGGVYCKILVQADDVVLLTLPPNDLHTTLDICFQLNAIKTKDISVCSIKHIGLVQNACQKGCRAFAAVPGCGARPHSLHPLTATEGLQVVLPTTSYDAELLGTTGAGT